MLLQRYKKFFVIVLLVLAFLCFSILYLQSTETLVRFSQIHKIPVLIVETQQNNRMFSTISYENYDTNKVLMSDHISKLCQIEDYTKLVTPCLGQMKWTDRSNVKTRTSSVKYSTVKITVRPYPYVSSVKIKTRDDLNRLKYSGGDYWDVKVINGNTREKKLMVNIEMEDLNNGSYIGYFMLPKKKKEDTYKVVCNLEYSQCNGIRDPPLDWFIKGKMFE